MKHQKSGRQFGRNRAQRTALMRTLVGSLIMYGRIETTQAKAKELKGVIDRVITRAKRSASDMHVVRKLEKDVPLGAIKKLLHDMSVKRFDGRESGYTRVVSMAPRKSDASAMAVIAFVDDIKESAQKEDTAKKEDAEKTTAKNVKAESKESVKA